MKSELRKSSKKKKLGKEVTFEFFAPQADSVGLAGSFNDWDPLNTPLKQDSSGKWTVVVALPVGRYEYRYFVDETWQNDQRTVECIPNPFGTWNCVMVVH